MGSSGGGGASGAVSHSPYLETLHGDWLNKTGVDVIEKSMTEVMDSALGSSPWTGLVAYDPDPDIAAYEAVLVAFGAVLGGLSDTVNWASLYAQADLTIGGIGEATIIADAAAFASILDADLNTKILPRFRRGMQDINAVVSSAFVLGEAVIEGFRDRELAKYVSALRINIQTDINTKKISATDQMVQMMGRRITWKEEYAKIFIEASRIKLVAKKEETDKNAAIDEADAKWDLGVFQFGSNLLASIGGGTAVPYMPGTNIAASTLGGALAVVGAAAQVYSAVK